MPLNPWELAANAFNAASILLAGRNRVHTWWTGIVASVLFAWVFQGAKLYADMTLQGFFIVTSVIGWMFWRPGRSATEQLPVRRTPPRTLALLGLTAAAVAGGYGWLLFRFTDAYAPFLDSAVLAFSVLGQFLLIGRRVETWWCWLLVNTLSVPLFASRELYLTAALYAGFWVNAVVSLWHWQRLLVDRDRFFAN